MSPKAREKPAPGHKKTGQSVSAEKGPSQRKNNDNKGGSGSQEAKHPGPTQKMGGGEEMRRDSPPFNQNKQYKNLSQPKLYQSFPNEAGLFSNPVRME